MFSPVLKFTLFERFSKEYLEVSESMKLMERKHLDMMNQFFISELSR